MKYIKTYEDSKIKMYYHVTKYDDVEKFYRKLKRHKLNNVWFDIPDSEDEIVVISNMTELQKTTKFFKKEFWSEDPKVIAYIMINFKQINIEDFIENLPTIKASNKYNI